MAAKTIQRGFQVPEVCSSCSPGGAVKLNVIALALQTSSSVKAKPS